VRVESYIALIGQNEDLLLNRIQNGRTRGEGFEDCTIFISTRKMEAAIIAVKPGRRRPYSRNENTRNF